MPFHKIVWSPVEVEYLKKNYKKMPYTQLSIALSKTIHAVKKKIDEIGGKVVTKKQSRRSVIGRRTDLNHFFRSNWEANVARWFNYLKRDWLYEPQVFTFTEYGIKRGTISYLPDFKVGEYWVEVKGFLDTKGRTAIRRFKKFYPAEFSQLRAIVGSPNTGACKFFKEMGVPILAYINELNKEFKDKIPHWE